MNSLNLRRPQKVATESDYLHVELPRISWNYLDLLRVTRIYYELLRITRIPKTS